MCRSGYLCPHNLGKLFLFPVLSQRFTISFTAQQCSRTMDDPLRHPPHTETEAAAPPCPTTQCGTHSLQPFPPRPSPRLSPPRPPHLKKGAILCRKGSATTVSMTSNRRRGTDGRAAGMEGEGEGEGEPVKADGRHAVQVCG